MKNVLLSMIVLALSPSAFAKAVTKSYSLTVNPHANQDGEVFAKSFKIDVQVDVEDSAVAAVRKTPSVICTDNDCHDTCQISAGVAVGTSTVVVTDLETGKVLRPAAQAISAGAATEIDGSCDQSVDLSTPAVYATATNLEVSVTDAKFPALTLYFQGPSFSFLAKDANSYKVSDPKLDEQLNGTVMYYPGGKVYVLGQVNNGRPDPNSNL